LKLAQDLGWKEGIATTTTTTTSISKTSGKAGSESSTGDEDDIWDSDSDTKSKGEGSGGMGNVVSTMTLEGEEEREEGTLHELAISGNVEELKAIVEGIHGIDLNEKDEFGYTPLHLASDRGHVAVVKLLLSRKVDCSIQDADEFTALDLARIAEHDEVVSLLEGQIAS